MQWPTTATARLLAAAVGDVGGAGVIEVLDAASGRGLVSFAGHRQMIWELAFSPDGRRLASLASFPMQVAEVKLWDLAGGREMLTLKTTGVDQGGGVTASGISGFAFSPDGHRLLVSPRRVAPRGRGAGLGRHADAGRAGSRPGKPIT